MSRSNSEKGTSGVSRFFGFIILALVCVLVSSPQKARAVSASEWRPGNIIDDSIFYNGASLSTQDIQSFLSSKVPTCDTWGVKASEYGGGTRAQYGTSKGYAPPYTCLKDYSQNGISAAQIIKNAADTYGISPKTLIVLLQKEQTLVTDDWPWSSQYRSATGYGCPDTAPCDAEYYGFTNQVMKAAFQFRRYATYPTEYRYKPYQSNFIQYNPNAACGGTNVIIENKATAGLYNYTPYQPNSSALSNLYGSGDGCGAYGNRNFWRLFTDWFGTTHGTEPYLGRSLANGEIPPETTLESGDFMSSPDGRFVSVMQADGNLVTYRGTRAVWHSGTYGNYGARAKFQADGNLVIYRSDNSVAWHTNTFNSGANKVMLKDDGNLYIYANSTQKYTTGLRVSSSATTNKGTMLLTGTVLSQGDYLRSQDDRYLLVMQSDGNLVLFTSEGGVLWNSGTWGNQGASAVMQSDGNLVIYSASGRALWSSRTDGRGASTLNLQSDGNLVIYAGGGATWNTGTYLNNHRMVFRTGNQVSSGARLTSTEYMTSSDWRYRLIMQIDGNLVLYSVNNYGVLWNSGTWGNQGASAVMQSDGNLVIYSASGRALWSSRTDGRGASTLNLQSDGNLVIYAGGGATFSSHTDGKF